MALSKNVLILIGAGLFGGLLASVALLLKSKKKQETLPTRPALNQTNIQPQQTINQNNQIPKPSSNLQQTIKTNVQSIQKQEKPIFQIHEPTIPKLPDIKDNRLIDVRYPLIPPYTFAHIYWDNKNTELIYDIEEPKLTEKEKETLETLEEGIKEIINLSFISVSDKETLLLYLEKNIKVLLTELSIQITMDTFLKIMYYIYRDFVGLNDLEPLMNDSMIEDIECNGINTPVYIVHRKYRNIRTNLIHNDLHKMASFVEKLAQKCGRYVSYAEPLLDGSLPDGSRVNSTYTTDVSSRGPTYTIRKFSLDPWSPLHLISKGTVSFEIYAYLWMAVEYENSLMVIGGTGSGKCVSGDTIIHLADGKKEIIRNIIENNFKKNKIIKNENWEYIENELEILSMDPETLKIIKTKTDKLWRHKAKELIYIKTKSGRELKVTPEHPFFSIDNGELIKIRADSITKYQIIAVPRKIEIENPEIKYIDYLEYIKNKKDLFYNKKEIKKAIKILKKNYNINEIQLAQKFKIKYETFMLWKKYNTTPLNIAYKILKEAGMKLSLKHIKIKNEKSKIKLPKLCPELFKFIGYILGNGHLTKTQIIFFNRNKELRKEFLNLGDKLFGIKGKEEFPKNLTEKALFKSKYIATILHETFEIPYGNKSYIIKTPKQLYEMSNECISNFLSALFNCESYVGKNEIEFSTTSKFIAPELCNLLLRFGIAPRLITKKNHFIIYVMGYNNILLFKNNIGYSHPEKNKNLDLILSKPLNKLILNTDLIPNVSKLISNMRLSMDINQNYIVENVNVSRGLMSMREYEIRKPSIITFKIFNNFIQEQELGSELKNNINRIVESDIFWDEISEIKNIDNCDDYVYDLTVPNTHNFLAGEYPIIAHNTSFINTVAFFIPPQARVVSIEDTKELRLEHENWLPSVARAGVGLTNLIGQRYGEVNLFDLLRASFRQRPDYIIVGEVRGKEAFVLFQAFASIRGNEEIFVLKDNKPLRIRIKDLENEDITKLKAISYNIKEKKCELLQIKGWIKHPKRNILYKIKTKLGREVTITQDHSVFTLDNNEIKEIKGEQLVIGSSIIIPSYLECGYNNIKEINLLEYLPDLRIYAPELVKQASHKLRYYQSEELINYKSITTNYSEDIIKKSIALKAEKFLKLMKEANIEYNKEELIVKHNGMSEKCDVKFELSDEFLKLLGYYISKGSLNTSGRNYRIEFYNKDEDILKDMENCIIKVTNKKPFSRITDCGLGETTELSFNNKIIYEIIKRYCKTKLEKRIPDFIFGLDKKRIGIFLSTLYCEYGHLGDKGTRYYTTSKNLASDVAQILLVYGIVASISKINRIGRKTTDYEINFYANYKKDEFLKYVNPMGKTRKITAEIVDKNLLGDLYSDEIKSIEVLQLDEPEYVYDISVPGNQNFIGGFGSILLHNSGHPGMATMHAEDVNTLIKRLETEPINLSGSLIETLALVVVMSQTKIKGKEVRKVSSVDEIIEVKEHDGGVVSNKAFSWDPRTDTFSFNTNSKVFEKIGIHYGFTKEQVMNEFKLRTKLLRELYKRGILGFKDVQHVIQEYYKSPETVLARYNIK